MEEYYRNDGDYLSVVAGSRIKDEVHINIAHDHEDITFDIEHLDFLIESLEVIRSMF